MFNSNASKNDFLKKTQLERLARQKARQDEEDTKVKIKAAALLQTCYRKKQLYYYLLSSLEKYVYEKLAATIQLNLPLFVKYSSIVLFLYESPKPLLGELKPISCPWKTHVTLPQSFTSHRVLNSLFEKQRTFNEEVHEFQAVLAKLRNLQVRFLYGYITPNSVQNTLDLQQCIACLAVPFAGAIDIDARQLLQQLFIPAISVYIRDNLSNKELNLDSWVQACLNLVKEPFVNLHLLCIPLVANFISFSDAWRMQMLRSNEIDYWLKSDFLKVEIGDAESAAYLLGNAATLFVPSVDTELRVVDLFTEIALRGLDFAGEGSTGGNPQAVQLHCLFKWYSGQAKAKTTPKTMLPLLRTQLALLWTDELLQSLVPKDGLADLWIDKSNSIDKPDSLGAKVMQVHMFARFFSAVFYLFESMRQQMLIKLCAARHIPPLLWRIICTVDHSGNWNPKSSGSLNALIDAVKRGNPESLFCFATFTMAVLIFPSYFSVVSQEETRLEKGELNFLAAHELRTISLFLNDFCFAALYASEYMDTLNYRGKAVTLRNLPREIEYALLMLRTLKQRNDRAVLPWVESNKLWLQKPCSKNSFWTQYREKQPRCVLLVQYMPWCVSFSSRVALLREMIELDKASLGHVSYSITVRRDQCFEDVFAQLSKFSGTQLKHPLKVKFVNQLGLEEQGLDMFGLFKEMVAEALREAFRPEFGLFKWTPANDGTVYFSSVNRVHGKQTALVMYEVIGKLVGKALYEGLVVDYPFPVFLYGKLMHRYAFLDELPFYDPQLYKQLMMLKTQKDDCSSWGLFFAVNEDHMGTLVETELKPGGSEIPVTSHNKYEYIYLLADYYLNVYCSEQISAYIDGFRSVFPESLLQLFSASELALLMTGERGPLDVKDLQQYTRYVNGYSASHPTIRAFWKIVSQMGQVDQSLLLQYITSCTHAPVGGFKHLNPPFTIAFIELEPADVNSTTGQFQVPNLPRTSTSTNIVSRFMSWTGLSLSATNKARLPMASTCFNLLKLPAYKSAKVLEERLLYAIRSQSGFEKL